MYGACCFSFILQVQVGEGIQRIDWYLPAHGNQMRIRTWICWLWSVRLWQPQLLSIRLSITGSVSCCVVLIIYTDTLAGKHRCLGVPTSNIYIHNITLVHCISISVLLYIMNTCFTYSHLLGSIDAVYLNFATRLLQRSGKMGQILRNDYEEDPVLVSTINIAAHNHL